MIGFTLQRPARTITYKVFIRGGIGVGVKGVTGRDAIVHKRQRNSSHKELVARHFPFFSGFRGATIAQ